MVIQRQPVPHCAPDTFKYFVADDQVMPTWERLAAHYGAITTTAYTLEIFHERFIFRSTCEGNPIIAIRRRRCQPADVAQFHQLIGFEVRP